MANSDFVTQFYNLQGDAISERKKNFFKLLKSQSVPLTEEDLKSLRPRTYLEKLFEIDILVYFKIYGKLLDVIKEGNAVFISKILKHPPILKEIIGNISAESFVNDFLPMTSYSLRMKVLKRISFFLNESQMDDIIFWVHKRYGFYIASKILHTCSSKKIKEYFSNEEVTLKPRQVKFIFDKDPELFHYYLSYYKKMKKQAYNHKNVYRYVALKNPQFWLNLKKEEAMRVARLGRRTSKLLIRHGDFDIRNNIESCSKFLRLDTIVYHLRGQFKEIYFELFPRQKSNVTSYNFCQILLKHYSKKKQWDLFAETFTRVFEEQILDNLIHLNYNFVALFPNKSITQKWGEVHYDKDQQNDFLKYCDPKTAVPLIKEKINLTSNIRDRTQLVFLLLENCMYNKDYDSLEGVLKYISVRHKNEQEIVDVLNQFSYIFKMDELNDNHWQYINEIIAFLRAKNKTSPGTSLVLKYIGYLCLSGRPFKNELVAYVKDDESIDRRFYIQDLRNPAVEKEVWSELVKVYPEVVKMNAKEYKKHQESFIKSIIQFNDGNKEHFITLSDFPTLFSYIQSIFTRDLNTLDEQEKDILKRVTRGNFEFPKPIIDLEEAKVLEIFEFSKQRFSFESVFAQIAKKENPSKFENRILQFFWGNLVNDSYIRGSVVRSWLSRKDASTLVPYYDRLLEVDRTCIPVKQIKLMSHFGVDKKLLDSCTRELERVDRFLKALSERNAMEAGSASTEKLELNINHEVFDILSVLLPTKGFIEIVANRFVPTGEKVEDLGDFYYTQCTVVKNFKKLQEPALVLPILMKFCEGAYLQSALPSLYSLCYRAPENILYAHMDELSKKAVSARKHAIFLSCELLNFDYTLSKLQNINESNISSQKHVFSATLKYFRKNPCDQLFDLVVNNLNKINENDQETMKSLVKITVPKKYSGLYIEKCWYFLEGLREKKVKVQDYLQSFFSNMVTSQDIFLSLSTSFVRHIITHYFTDVLKDDYSLSELRNFVCLVLQNGNSEQTANFKFVFDIISRFKKNNSKNVIKAFFDTFYNIAEKDVKNNCNIDKNNNYYIELFKQYWYNIFTPIEMFEEHLSFDLLYLKSKSCGSVENYAREVSVYLEELVAQYGFLIYYKFKSVLLHKVAFTGKEKYLFLYNVLKFKNSTLNCVLALDFLECQNHIDDKETEKEVRKIHQDIMEILENTNELVVSVYLQNRRQTCFDS